ncbi:MAG: TSUP family transporter [Defluviitaleaceae bacterium]|nr:TSUP family transporter [Defluviitaleaceae bacterium]
MLCVKLLMAGVLCGIFNGLLGSGGGVVAVLSLRRFFDVETHKSHATAVAIMLPMTVVSAIIYLGIYDTDVMTAVWITMGGVVGGVVGARLLGRISAKWLHKIFGAVMIFAAVRMVL